MARMFILLNSYLAAVSKQAQPLACIQRAGEFTKYWVYLNNGLIAVGKGSDVGSKEILRWKDPNPNTHVRESYYTWFYLFPSFSLPLLHETTTSRTDNTFADLHPPDT